MLKKLAVTTVVLLVTTFQAGAVPLEIVAGLGTVLQKEPPYLEETSIVACHYISGRITVLTVVNNGQPNAYAYTTTLSLHDSFIFNDGGVRYRATVKSMLYGCSTLLELEVR